MEKGVNHDRIAAWRWVASILIYPVTILPGLNATVLLISSVCVGLDSWSLEGALTNISLGFPAVAGIAALWFSTLTPILSIARSRWRFLLVTTGLMMGLLMECLFLKAGIQNQAIRLPWTGFLELWVFGGPLLAGFVNLALLISARHRLYRRFVPVPVPVRRFRLIIWAQSESCGLCDWSPTSRQRPCDGGYRPSDPAAR